MKMKTKMKNKNENQNENQNQNEKQNQNENEKMKMKNEIIVREKGPAKFYDPIFCNLDKLLSILQFCHDGIHDKVQLFITVDWVSGIGLILVFGDNKMHVTVKNCYNYRPKKNRGQKWTEGRKMRITEK